MRVYQPVVGSPAWPAHNTKPVVKFSWKCMICNRHSRGGTKYLNTTRKGKF